jgi:hypothetical protein
VNLSDELRLQLVQAVLDFIGDPPPPALVTTLAGNQVVIDAPPAMNGFKYSQWIIEYSLRQPTKDIFVRVIREADQGQALVALHALVDRLEADDGLWSAPAEGLWIPTGWPFVDRRDLRDKLTAMVAGDGPAALAVEGPFGNGKRTTGLYIRHLADQTNAFEPVIRELRPEPVPGALDDIVTDLWMAMAYHDIVDLETTHEEPERQAKTLARRAALAAQSAPLPVWFVANVMEQNGLEEGVLSFVDELLRLVQGTGQIAEKLRVIVLCDQLSLLELENPPPLKDRHTLPQISDVEIREWLQAAAPGKDPTLYELAAETVMRSLQSQSIAPARQLRRLSLSCALAHSKLAT